MLWYAASGASVIACIVAAMLDPGDWRVALLAVPIVAFVVGKLRRYELCGTQTCDGRVQLGQRCARCDSLAVSEDHPWS